MKFYFDSLPALPVFVIQWVVTSEHTSKQLQVTLLEGAHWLDCVALGLALVCSWPSAEHRGTPF